MTLLETIDEWDCNLSERPFYRDSFYSIFNILDYRDSRFFRHFTPTSGHEFPEFWDRMEDWLENVANEQDKKALFEFSLSIYFVTSRDFRHLFLSAFSGPIKRWVIDLHNIALDQQLDTNLNTQINQRTWYCSATDMNLGDFYRVNHITGSGVRPDFNTLSCMGDKTEIQAHITQNNYRQIVLLEDFVGSGSQFEGILNRCSDYFGKMPILFVPLLICSNGLRFISEILASHDNWRIDPVIVINEDERLTSGTDLSEKPLESVIDNIAQFFSHQANCPAYGHNNTGALIVMHTNTPDNTLPLIWWTDNWNALFPRSSRTES